jgi:peroxiredoxin (alkyl hydroperoxide reductase subunit C)
VTLQIGSPAPDLALRDQHGSTVRLSDFAGERGVVLVFFPFAFSGRCTGELSELRNNLDLFEDASVQLIGVSCDPVHAQRAWAEAEKYDFPLLSDFWPHGKVARSYGVFSETMGAAIRGTFLVDRDGVLQWSIVNGPGEARPLSAYREAVASL